MSDVTPIRPEGEFDPTGQNSAFENTDPLEDLLDEQSDEDFGYVVTRDRATGPDGHPVKLAEWSAQDFASIYTRFRPHLERHARRFLHNPSQVDEVVQDAFLYLMVSLPELDSEIGVLRFLKWKVRLLCLDVMRASGKAYVASIDDVAEPVSADPEVSSYLEQQDDAAVLRLALSKLNPRHREVLLASIYEEKSTEQIAAQVGLSENATRQLIFRARAAFKKALLGDEVNTNGMSAAAILSVATRKAAMEAKKVGAQAMVFVLFMMLAIGAFVNFSGRGTQTQQLAESGSESVAPAATEEPTAPAPSGSASQTPAASSEVVQIPAIETPAAATRAKPALPVSNLAASAPVASLSPFTKADLAKIFDVSKSDSVIVKTSVKSVGALNQPADYRVFASQGIFLDFTFDLDAEQVISNAIATVMISDNAYFVSPSDLEIVAFKAKDGLNHIVFLGSLKDLRDAKGRGIPSSELSASTVRLEIAVSADENSLESSSLLVLSAGK